jgi:hypothetical protein
VLVISILLLSTVFRSYFGTVLTICWTVLTICWTVLTICWTVQTICWTVLTICWTVLTICWTVLTICYILFFILLHCNNVFIYLQSIPLQGIHKDDLTDITTASTTSGQWWWWPIICNDDVKDQLFYFYCITNYSTLLKYLSNIFLFCLFT